MGKNGDRSDRKKLSWIYRRKKKSQKSKNKPENTNENVQLQNKKARLIVRNLPFKATEEDVKQFYDRFGQIEEINLLRHPDGKPVGCGFVQFKRIEDASKAIFNTNKKEFQGRVISSSWAIPKSKFCEKLQKNLEDSQKTEEDKQAVEIDDEEGKEDKEIDEDKDESEENADENKITEEKHEEKKDVKQKKEMSKKQISVTEKQKRRKLQKEKSRKKRARIVVRNVPFQATEENLKEHFSKYGEIEEVEILTKKDGKHVGCAFVQFKLVQSAAKAIHYANLKPLLERPIVVDWAMPKNKFCKKETEDVKAEIKAENVEAEVKMEDGDENSDKDVKDVSLDTTGSSIKRSDSCEELGSEDEEDEEGDEGSESETSDNEVSEIKEEDLVKAEGEGDENDDEEEEEDEDEKDVKRPRRESHDVSEGKTVFLKNVPFSVKSDDLKRYIERFGPVYYALVCMDPLTEYSKGTAFVKFRNVEDAEKCLTAGEDLRIDDQVLEAHRALERNEVENKANLKNHKEKDSRNLYLVKEGVILAGSSAAAGVSAADMAKRLQLEQWKSQILRNLNMFVSRVRLVVHNLPPSLDDSKLREILQRHSGPKAVIREARVMRDLKNVDAKGVGKSKEYGFVSFTTHEDALKALRSINNNPNVFHKNKRPIVAFSIENRVMVNAKQKRIEKSREHNPLWPGNNAKRKNDDKKNDQVRKKRSKTEHTNEADVKPYAGTVGKPGENKLRSKFKLKTQAMVHSQTVKKDKKRNKSAKKLEAKRKENEKSRKEVKPKQGAKVNPDDVNLDKLVNSYKTKLQSISLKKSKWYEA